MCVQNDGAADLLAEFSISETGGIDGEPGDQTGRESSIHAYYSGSWDFILHYNGKADGGGASGCSSGGAASASSGNLPIPKYRVHWMGSSPRWGKWELDDTDDYAGNMADPIDMVQCMIVKA